MSALQAVLVAALLLVLVAAFVLRRRANAARRAAGLPAGEIVYADVGQRVECAPLHALRYGLAGKPDYLLRLGGEIIPVEVKPGRRAAQPYSSDVMQLAAYCLLVEETWGRRPSHGLLRYQERTFRLPFNDSLRESLLATLSEMRSALSLCDLSRSHDDPGRCRHCGYRERCSERLA